MKKLIFSLGFLAGIFALCWLMPSFSQAQETPTPEPTATSTPEPTVTGTPEPTATPTATSTPTPNPLNEVCSSIVREGDIPRCFIYKGGCQSGHIPRADPRSKGIGVITMYGCSINTPACVNVYSSRGNLIGKMGAYLALYPYQDRLYSNYGCGRQGGDRNTIDRKAKRLGNGKIYLKVGLGRRAKCLQINSTKSMVHSGQTC